MAFTQLPFHPMTSEIGAQTLYTPAFDLGGMTELDMVANVNCIKTGATFDVSLQHSMDLKDWYALGTLMVDVTAIGNKVKAFTDFMRYVRASAAIRGAGGYVTYSILGIAKDGV